MLLRAAATTKSCPTDPVPCASHIPIQNWHAEPHRQLRTRANKIHTLNAAAPRPSHCARSSYWHAHARACTRVARGLHAHSARMTPQAAIPRFRSPMQHSTRKCRTSHTAATTVYCENITAHHRRTNTAHKTPHSTVPRTPHTHTLPTNNTSCHTRRFCATVATLTSELSACPASMGCCRRVGCYSIANPCRAHEDQV